MLAKAELISFGDIRLPKLSCPAINIFKNVSVNVLQICKAEPASCISAYTAHIPQACIVHADKRGTGSTSTYKGNAVGSVPEYSFHWNGKSNRLYLFEAPIDMLSFISMNKDGWRNHNYAAACSVSDKVLFQCLQDNPNIKNVSICFDSDEPGQLAAQRITAKLVMQNIESEILVPINNDWNEDLLCGEGLEVE